MRPRALPPILYPACIRTRNALGAAVNIGPGLVCLVGGSGSGKTYALKLFELAVKGRRVAYRMQDADVGAACDVDMVDDVSSPFARRLSSDNLSGIVRVLSLRPDLLEGVLRIQPSALIVWVRAMEKLDIEFMVNERCDHLGVEKESLTRDVINAFVQASDGTPRRLDQIVGRTLQYVVDEGSMYITASHIEKAACNIVTRAKVYAPVTRQDAFAPITPNTLNYLPVAIEADRNLLLANMQNANFCSRVAEGNFVSSFNIADVNLAYTTLTPILRFEVKQNISLNPSSISMLKPIFTFTSTVGKLVGNIINNFRFISNKISFMYVPILKNWYHNVSFGTTTVSAMISVVVVSVAFDTHQHWLLPLQNYLEAGPFVRHDHPIFPMPPHGSKVEVTTKMPTTMHDLKPTPRDDFRQEFSALDIIQTLILQDHASELASIPHLPPRINSGTHIATLRTSSALLQKSKSSQSLVGTQTGSIKDDRFLQLARVMDAIGQKEDAQEMLRASASMGNLEAEQLLSR